MGSTLEKPRDTPHMFAQLQDTVCEACELGRRRTQVPVVAGGKSAVRVQTVDLV